jgi:hypothetical protein
MAQCHYRGYIRRLTFRRGNSQLEVSWEVSRELEALTAYYEESDTVRPPPVLHRWELECTPRPLKWTYAQASK